MPDRHGHILLGDGLRNTYGLQHARDVAGVDVRRHGQGHAEVGDHGRHAKDKREGQRGDQEAEPEHGPEVQLPHPRLTDHPSSAVAQEEEEVMQAEDDHPLRRHVLVDPMACGGLGLFFVGGVLGHLADGPDPHHHEAEKGHDEGEEAHHHADVPNMSEAVEEDEAHKGGDDANPQLPTESQQIVHVPPGGQPHVDPEWEGVRSEGEP
mmetsp:Transcript_34635/g.78303  ORF Transcript_34635/g.78303 Transcript_34635/m.78303 type:complete len:208 (+) Transcript_34635:106-729(+)